MCLCFLLEAQQTILINENRSENGIQATIPIRTVENNEDGITVTYVFDKAILAPDPVFPEKYFVRIEGFGQNCTPEEYSYLERLDNILIPAGCSVSVQLVSYQYEDYSVKLSPSRPLLLENERNTSSISDIPFPKNHKGFYPTEIVTLQHSNGNLARVLVKPVQYNAETGKLRIPKKLVYKLSYDASSTKSNFIESHSKSQMIENVVLNPSSKFSATENLIPEGYVIISSPKYEKAVNRFSEWKRLLGFEVKASCKETWNNASVKSEIKRLYNQEQRPTYLLILGDNADIPGIRKFNIMGDGYVTDYYYGFVTSDTLGLPDLHRGRIPVNTEEEANRVVDKIINYEKNPVTNVDFYKNAVHATYFQDDNDPEGYEDRRFTRTSEDIRAYVMDKGKRIGRVYFAKDDVSPVNWNSGLYGYGEEIPADLRKPNFAWNGCAEDVNNAINNGIFYLFHRGHGVTARWVQPNYEISDFSGLHNKRMTPVVFNINCRSGRFEDECFAEHLLKMEGGCVGIFAATIESYSQPNDALACGLFDAIWPMPGLRPVFKRSDEPSTFVVEPIYGLGKILDQGLIRMEETFSYERIYQREIFHCLGDPGMMIATEPPSCFENVNIVRRDSNVTVTTGVEYARISFYNKYTGEGKVVDSNEASFECNDIENVSVVISGHNKTPYIDYRATKDTVYIQNETVDANRVYAGDKIVIGNNVNSDIPYGETVFSSGKIKLIGNDIIFDAGVRSNLGVELKTEKL